MFRRLPEVEGDMLHFTVDGRAAVGRRGDTVAAALLAAGMAATRTTAAGGRARGPYCLMGVCFDCLVVIDGIGNCQACLIPLDEGMSIETQRRGRAIGEEAARKAMR